MTAFTAVGRRHLHTCHSCLLAGLDACLAV